MKKIYNTLFLESINALFPQVLQRDKAHQNSLIHITQHTLNIYIIFFILCGFINSVRAQTTIYTTDFGTVANVNPAQWTFTGIDMNISTNNSSSGYTGASGGACLGEGNSVAFINTSGTSFAGSQVGTSEAILLVNSTGYSTVTVSFGMRKSSAGYNSNATYTLAWSSNGVNYTTIPYTEATAGGWGLASGPGLTLPAAAGNQSTLYLKWTFVRTGTASNFKIDDVSVIGNTSGNVNAPTIVMDLVNTTNYLDGGVSVPPASPYAISGVINDPTDPARTIGLDFTINDPQTAASNLTVTIASSDVTVVPNANVVVTGSGASRNVKIIPIGVGYSNIIINVSDGTNITPYSISYAASAASSTPSNTIWHTGMSDGSDAIAIDDNYYISGDDELDILNVYSRSASGLPFVSYDYSSALGLSTASSPEVDLEAGTRSTSNANKVYWMGSMSTGGSAFTIRPNRDRLFATTFSGTGASTSFSVVGYYASLRTQLVTWGDANGYNFSASSAAGMDSKNVAGFAAEGMVFGPDNTTLYIGLRAPLVPTANRTKAVIAPIGNFETWFNNGSPSGNPAIGTPIELNLGGRGIRDLIRLTNGTYIIVAGNSASSPITSAIYKWTGNASDAPILVVNPLNAVLNMEGAMQVNVNSQPSMTQLQIISDGGGDIIYNDNNEAKDLADLNWRKFRCDNLNGIDLCLITPSSTPVITESGLTLTSTSGTTYQWFLNNLAIAGATLQNYSATENGNYSVIVTNSLGCAATSENVTVSSVGIVNYLEGKNKITVSPNPVQNKLMISIEKLSNPCTIELFDLNGIRLLTLTPIEKNTLLDISEYANGLYVLRVTNNDSYYMSKIIKD